MKLKNIKWKTLLFCIAIPLFVGGASALLTMENMRQYAEITKPPLSPPSWLFAVVWTALYILMGIASYLVIEARGGHTQTTAALRYYFIQLAFNFIWPIIFFNMGAYFLAFLWLLVLLVLIVITTVLFGGISRTAAYLMIPYIAWVVFAGYLNLGVALLN